MFREKEICNAIRTAYLYLFPDKKERKRALSRLNMELVAQSVRYRGESVLAYQTTGNHECSLNYYGPELFPQRGFCIYQKTIQSHSTQVDIHAAIITIVMLCIDWRIGLTILCGILLFTWCIGRLQKKSETVSPQRQQAQEALVSNVLEYVQGMLIVKSFNLGQNSNSKMRQAILDSKDKNLKLERTFVPYNMLQQIILYGTSILVIVEGLYFYLNGTMALSICLLMTVASFIPKGISFR